MKVKGLTKAEIEIIWLKMLNDFKKLSVGKTGKIVQVSYHLKGNIHMCNRCQLVRISKNEMFVAGGTIRKDQLLTLEYYLVEDKRGGERYAERSIFA